MLTRASVRFFGLRAPPLSVSRMAPKHISKTHFCSKTESDEDLPFDTKPTPILDAEERGYEDEFFKKFYYLGKRSTKKFDMAKENFEIYREQVRELDADIGDDGKIIKKETVEEDEISLMLDDQPYAPGEFIDMKPFEEKYLAEGYPGRIEEFEFEWIQNRETMTRQVNIDIITELENQKDNGFLESRGTKPIFLDGLSGTGKSVSLAHSVLYARSRDWLVLYIPDAYKLVSKYRVKPSMTRKWIYDLHEGAVEIMEGFKKAHEDKLSQINMKTTLPGLPELKSFNDTQTKLTTLLDLINFGITSENPSEVFLALRSELDSVTEFPVLIAVDNINYLYGNTGFMKQTHLKSPKIEWVDGSEISVLLAFNRPETTSMINGTTISSLTTQYPKKHMINQITEKEFEDSKIFTVTSYTYEEFSDRVTRYITQGDMQTSPSTLTRQYIYSLCCGRPKQVANYIAMIL